MTPYLVHDFNIVLQILQILFRDEIFVKSLCQSPENLSVLIVRITIAWAVGHCERASKFVQSSE